MIGKDFKSLPECFVIKVFRALFGALTPSVWELRGAGAGSLRIAFPETARWHAGSHCEGCRAADGCIARVPDMALNRTLDICFLRVEGHPWVSAHFLGKHPRRKSLREVGVRLWLCGEWEVQLQSGAWGDATSARGMTARAMQSLWASPLMTHRKWLCYSIIW